MIKINHFVICTLASLLLTGCMSSTQISKDDASLTMQEIYESHFVNLEYDESKYVFMRGHEDRSESAQRIKNQVKQTFPTLKNPFLVMYVFPHLNAEDGTPIPGYWTTFPLYDKVEFALPGEEIFGGDTD